MQQMVVEKRPSGMRERQPRCRFLMASAALVWTVVLLMEGDQSMSAERDRPVVIAHRGASGYLPEHTLPAKALAFGMGADYLEQDVVLTKDDHPLVLHDIHLDTVTNVAKVFPLRHRDDGRYYALDFTLDEIKQLQVRARFDRGTGRPVFPSRFSASNLGLHLVSLSEEIEFVQGLSRSTNRDVGIYPEIKAPAWHRAQGRDISRIVLRVLERFGYRERADRIYLQCFDATELRRIRAELGSELKLIQLIGESRSGAADNAYAVMRTPAGLAEIAKYSDGIGPRIEDVLGDRGVAGDGPSPLVEMAHRQQLVVHPYTFRTDALPRGTTESSQLLRTLFEQAQVDGLFTDFPDTVVHYLAARKKDD